MKVEPEKPEVEEEKPKESEKERKARQEEYRRKILASMTPQERASMHLIKRFWDDTDEEEE